MIVAVFDMSRLTQWINCCFFYTYGTTKTDLRVSAIPQKVK